MTAIQSQFKSDVFTSRSQVVEDLQGLADAVEIKKYVDTVSDQIKHLKTAVEHTIELNKNKVRGPDDGSSGMPLPCILINLIVKTFLSSMQRTNIIARKLKSCKSK